MGITGKIREMIKELSHGIDIIFEIMPKSGSKYCFISINLKIHYARNIPRNDGRNRFNSSNIISIR
jgi:hypothetical protein